MVYTFYFPGVSALPLAFETVSATRVHVPYPGFINGSSGRVTDQSLFDHQESQYESNGFWSFIRGMPGPVFCRTGQNKTPCFVYLVVPVSVYSGEFQCLAWIVSNIAFLTPILALATSTSLFRFLVNHTFSARFFMFFGNISFHLFMVNGFLRSPFHDFAETYHRWWIDNLAAVASLLFSTLCAYCLSALDHHLRAVFRSKS